ncbi:hypothetical protein BS78_K309700 [Paspalum vaginatum]|uniref:Photosystem I assembly protein Ycf4 n=1 Tax=Paspalum vaginatum TaxID=158149 RepID=A0A9W7X7T9_9POAL|nr:hypothetical protein BS78_K309700 [Paspalum vaginatum]
MNWRSEHIWIELLKGSRKRGNFFWACILFLGSLGFLAVGASSYLEGIVHIFRWGFLAIKRRIFLRFLGRDIQPIRIQVKEGLYPRRILYMEIWGQGVIPLTHTDEMFFTPREIEQKAAELAYFLRVPIEVF